MGDHYGKFISGNIWYNDEYIYAHTVDHMHTAHSYLPPFMHAYTLAYIHIHHTHACIPAYKIHVTLHAVTSKKHNIQTRGVCKTLTSRPF